MTELVENRSLRDQLLKQTVWGIANTLLSTLFGVLSFFWLARILPREEIGFMGVATGFFALLHPLLVAPEILLFREYSQVKQRLTAFASGFIFFGVLRTAIVMGVIALGAWWLGLIHNSFLLAIYIVGAGLAMNLNLLQATIQELFFVEFKQEITVKTNVVYYLLFLVLLGSLLFNRSLWMYLSILVGLSILFLIIWLVLLKRKLKIHLEWNIANNLRIIREMMVRAFWWNHWVASCLQVLYRADVLVLSFFVSATVTGNYTVALMFSSFFVLFPQILQKMCMAGLARAKDTAQETQVVNAFLRYSVVVSIAQIIAYAIAGKWILNWIVPGDAEEVFILGFWIVAGVNLFNAVRPLHSLALARADLKKLFWRVYAPCAAIALVVYAFFVYNQLALGAAKANLVVYGFLTFLLVWFVKREIRVGWRFNLEFEREWKLVAEKWLQKKKV